MIAFYTSGWILLLFAKSYSKLSEQRLSNEPHSNLYCAHGDVMPNSSELISWKLNQEMESIVVLAVTSEIT